MVLRILIYHIFISQVQTNCTRVVGRGRIFELTLEMTKFPEGLLKRKLWVGRQYFLTLFWYADIRYICSEAFRWVVVWDTHPCLIKEPISWDWVDTRWVSKFQKTPAEVTGPIGRQGQSVYKQGVKFLLLAAEELQTPCFGLLRFFFSFSKLPHPELTWIWHCLDRNFKQKIVMGFACAERLDICSPLFKQAGYILCYLT